MRPVLAFLLLLPACDAGHLGNPLLLPAAAVTNAAQNAAYDSRRAKVAAYVKTHHNTLLSEAAQGAGPHLNASYDLARVPAAARERLSKQIHAERALYQESRENLVITLMVHGR